MSEDKRIEEITKKIKASRLKFNVAMTNSSCESAILLAETKNEVLARSLERHPNATGIQKRKQDRLHRELNDLREEIEKHTSKLIMFNVMKDLYPDSNVAGTAEEISMLKEQLENLKEQKMDTYLNHAFLSLKNDVQTLMDRLVSGVDVNIDMELFTNIIEQFNPEDLLDQISEDMKQQFEDMTLKVEEISSLQEDSLYNQEDISQSISDLITRTKQMHVNVASGI
eukprot:TRINITY_DN11720_c0_g1_i1.p1 TRINITY_DN11720_c0_g1~~TRINITY_DN11720_c0_g1_i1.p1  ORF type:complete len:226 (+),score=48.79 TRINITY_DN11720_c0_g1_i1:219-896(+)